VLAKNRNHLKTGMFEYDDVFSLPIETEELFAKILSWFNLAEKLEKLTVNEQEYRNLIEFFPNGILIQSGDKIVFANETILKMLGINDGNVLLGSSVLSRIHPDYQAITKEKILTCNNHQKHVESIVQRMVRFDGKIIEVEMFAYAVIYKGKPALEIIIRDVTKRKSAEQQLTHLAYHDPLTGLYNRTAFIETINQAILMARRYKRRMAVLFLDLDCFKNINDTLGHQKGDLILQAVSERLLGCVRKSDIVARFGGDEFTLAILDVVDIGAVALVAQKILKIFSDPIIIDDQALVITPSIGISIYPDDGEDPHTLLRNADLAMYLAKKQGKNNYQYCKPELTKETKARASVQHRLKRALKNQDFQLLFQPKIDLNRGKIVGVETVLHWTLSNGKTVSPNEVALLAEETGLTIPVIGWVLRESCLQAKIWQDAGFMDLKVAINISGCHFKEPDFFMMIKNILKETQFPSRNLELEIAERLLLQDIDNALGFLKRLKKIGVQFSIDDFGTGYSSLRYLKKLDADRLKIDKMFVDDIMVNTNYDAVTDVIIAIAHSLKIKVVAVGIETKEQALLLKQKNCNEVQGDYFCKPVSSEELLLFLKKYPFIKMGNSHPHDW
jgi:diguanylate cyclase (GGDEF)-like protein/PAS domain S-box-containing protein